MNEPPEVPEAPRHRIDPFTLACVYCGERVDALAQNFFCIDRPAVPEGADTPDRYRPPSARRGGTDPFGA